MGCNPTIVESFAKNWRSLPLQGLSSSTNFEAMATDLFVYEVIQSGRVDNTPDIC